MDILQIVSAALLLLLTAMAVVGTFMVLSGERDVKLAVYGWSIPLYGVALSVCAFTTLGAAL